MIINKKFSYITLPRVEINGFRHYTCPDGTNVPSVTTILSQTKDTSGLDEWKSRVGEAEADRIKNEASTLGTGIHNNLELHIMGKPMVGQYMTRALAGVIVKHGLSKIGEIWGSEVSLFSQGLYAGTTDLVVLMKDGTPAIVDFKNSLSFKNTEWIDDYRAQLGAYSLAHNEMFGTDIRRGVLMIVTRDGKYQEFDFNGAEFDNCVEIWLERLDQYLKLIKKTPSNKL